MKKIGVLGSINMDISLLLESLPSQGETILATSKLTGPGGKGFNQAVSAARLGAEVNFIGKVGADGFGRQLVTTLQQEGVSTDHIYVDANLPTGEAIILLGSSGSNMIVVNSGSNMGLTPADIDHSEQMIADADIILAQFEVPVPVIEHAFALARSKGKITVLNPAPAKQIPASLLQLTDFLIPNESEMHIITGCDTDSNESISEGAYNLIQQGVGSVIVTLGERGSLICHRDGSIPIPAQRVQAIDTTAAGDSFIGAFCTQLDSYSDKPLDNIIVAVQFANRFSAIVVQRKGAFQSIPYIHELIDIQV